jgi:hypothetical protein
MESYWSLCSLDTIHRLFFVTRLIINQINKYNGWILSWRMSSVPLFLRNGELLGHSPDLTIMFLKIVVLYEIYSLKSRVTNTYVHGLYMYVHKQLVWDEMDFELCNKRLLDPLLGHSPIRINGNVQLYPTDVCDI